MDKKHRCKLCYRSFANGRALGGHMRSHMMKFYAEGKDLEQESGEIEHDFQSSSSPSSSSSDEESEEGLMSSYVLRDKRKNAAIAADRRDFVAQDGESETESLKIWRRSKRVRESRASDFEQSSPLSSISDTTPEEHVAHCLMMLSRDTWRQKIGRGYEGDEEEEESKKMAMKSKIRGRYRCEECNKLFRSYQALGGHRASHKKIKSAATAPPPPPEKSGGVKIHQCPFCDRIFSSGQALGGHKRSHFIGAAAISTNRNSTEKNSSRISQVLSIDLNLPAPADDDEGSQIAISAVSDAEFVCNVKQ
ncbi:hypothetical protein SASPL_100521 [Salvia splendens]|uniref:C2H2-type domain-containing protein n=1 Tax=Salvia splendens TaxID=180675 RepID=A0A8X9AAC9_SALSN|nr:zinc finger protein ZAT4-like [Salvia splendens]KAG6435647.1 hypothetical protein SASPL_100521 [Salvia splendens]